MANTTRINDVQDQVQKFWSNIFMPELQENLLLGGLVNKDYEGEIKRGGDEVFVSQLVNPQGQTKTIGVDADSFSSTKLQTRRIGIKTSVDVDASGELHYRSSYGQPCLLVRTRTAQGGWDVYNG